MHITLEELSRQCHDALKADPGPEGRQQVASLIQKALQDQDFINTHIGASVGEREILYEDAELGFCILAHNYKDPKTAAPHDHAHTWAIYGQARGETEMRDYEVVERPQNGNPGKVRLVKTYRLTPGTVHVYPEGAIHSPKRDAPTSLIRIEGQNMTHVRRDQFEIL